MTNIKAPKVEKSLPEFVDEIKMNQLLDSAVFEESEKGRKDYLIVLLLYSTGMRRAELIGLKIEHVDLDKGLLKVLGKGNKERLIPMTKELQSAMTLYLEDQKHLSGNLFTDSKGKPLYPNYVYRVVRKYLGKVSTRLKKSPHVLRHSFATGMLEKGADINAIKELLGHANLAATQIYTHISIEKLKNIYKLTHPKS